jgi:hypothetical protein
MKIVSVISMACVFAAASGTVNTVVYSLITQCVDQHNVGGKNPHFAHRRYVAAIHRESRRRARLDGGGRQFDAGRGADVERRTNRARRRRCASSLLRCAAARLVGAGAARLRAAPACCQQASMIVNRSIMSGRSLSLLAIYSCLLFCRSTMAQVTLPLFANFSSLPFYYTIINVGTPSQSFTTIFGTL